MDHDFVITRFFHFVKLASRLGLLFLGAFVFLKSRGWSYSRGPRGFVEPVVTTIG